MSGRFCGIDAFEIVYYTSRMAMGKRTRNRQPCMWVTTTDFLTAASHPFYTRLNQLLHAHGFDDITGTPFVDSIVVETAVFASCGAESES